MIEFLTQFPIVAGVLIGISICTIPAAWFEYREPGADVDSLPIREINTRFEGGYYPTVDREHGVRWIDNKGNEYQEK